MTKRLKKLLLKNLAFSVQNRVGPEVIKRVMDKFQVGLIGKVTTRDPAAPEHFKDEFFSMLNGQLESSLVVTQAGISFSLGDRDKLGYDGNVTTPLQTMVFLLEGIVGQYGFITSDVYSTHKSGKNIKFGRWSSGFLISKEVFFKEGWDKAVSWDKVHWGFSNTGPIDIFSIDQSFIAEIINSTIKETIEEFAASLRAEH